MNDYIFLIPTLPLIGSALNGIFGHWIRKYSGILASAAVGVGAVISFLVLQNFTEPYKVILFQWVVAGGFFTNIALQIDRLSLVMLMIVNGIGFLIHVYSIGYMREDPGYSRFFSFLNLFIFFMNMLVLADNFLLLYLGWEGVGLCSYLLIGFWYEKKSATDAGKKAFIVNRVGDFGFGLAVMLIFSTIGTVTYTEVFAHIDQLATAGVLGAVTLLLFLGATGKSAQIPLFTWLPDAMEGPTPVSALIHAATMVTAGVYMIARCSSLFIAAPATSEVVTWIGIGTAVFAATIGLAQNDIKKVLAYSTISQLGYMFVGVGVGAYSAGIYHLMTHAFFKALLFLGAGSVIHAMSGEQDIRKMGGIFRKVPITGTTFIIAVIAIAGIPPFAGFFSKDLILEKAYEHGHTAVWILGVIGAFLTAFYMSRLTLLTFFGESRVEEHAKHHLHESPLTMTIPLLILAVLSILGGLIDIPSWLGPAFSTGAASEAGKIGSEMSVNGGLGTAALMTVSVAAGAFGILFAWVIYRLKWIHPEAIAARFGYLYKLVLNKYYVDEIYDVLIVRPLKWLFLFCWNVIDTGIIEGIVNGIGKLVQLASELLRRIQTGYVPNYALSFALGVVAVLAYYLLR